MQQKQRPNRIVLSFIALLRRAGILFVLGVATVTARVMSYLLYQMIA